MQNHIENSLTGAGRTDLLTATTRNVEKMYIIGTERITKALAEIEAGLIKLDSFRAKTIDYFADGKAFFERYEFTDWDNCGTHIIPCNPHERPETDNILNSPANKFEWFRQSQQAILDKIGDWPDIDKYPAECVVIIPVTESELIVNGHDEIIYRTMIGAAARFEADNYKG